MSAKAKVRSRSRPAEGARALPAEGERRRRQKSLLLRHGRYPSQRPRRRQSGAPVLRHLRIRPIVSCDFGGSRRRPRFEGLRGFRQRQRCAKNFGNAMDSELTAGGAYVTGETKTSFKGYYRASAKQDAALIRSFVQFDGEGETANARQRAIGGHPAALLKGVCLRKDPHSPYANQDGYVPFGKLVEYSGGRSDGCTSWSPSDARQIIPMVKDDPTTLYIYPESARHRRRRTSGGRRPVAVARRISIGTRPA